VSTAVAGGYLLLVTSFGFNLHIWMGILISLAMVVSSFSALSLFPGLLMVVRPRFVFGARPAPAANGSKVGTNVAGWLLIAASTGSLLLAAGPAQAADPAPEQIMERNFMVSKVSDSISDGTFRLINASGQERVRDTLGRSKLLANGVDNMRMTRFTAPPDIKGTVSLLIEHSEKDDDIWIYLPALKKVRRLVSSNKKDSFVGTDFSYGDVIGFKVADWKHKLLKEETVEGQPCWVIESTPATPQIQSDSGYSKRVGWIRKDNFVSAKGEFYDEGGQLLKQVSASQITLVDPAKQRWQPMRLEAKNVQTNHRTVIEFRNYKANQNVSSEFFTTRYMERD
jgi:outer membrane lipoprotein-sorting protein